MFNSDITCRDCNQDASHYKFMDGQTCVTCGSLLCHECWEEHSTLNTIGVGCMFDDDDLDDEDWD